MKRFPPATAIIILFAACSGDQADHFSFVMPRALAAVTYEECYNGADFFRTDKAVLSARIPPGFVVGDGSMVDPSHEGYGLLALIYISCPRTDGGSDRVAMLATPIENVTTMPRAGVEPARAEAQGILRPVTVGTLCNVIAHTRGFTVLYTNPIGSTT